LHVNGEVVEEERAIALSVDALERTAVIRGDPAVDALDISGFSAQAGSDVDDFAINLALFVVDNRHQSGNFKKIYLSVA